MTKSEEKKYEIKTWIGDASQQTSSCASPTGSPIILKMVLVMRMTKVVMLMTKLMIMMTNVLMMMMMKVMNNKPSMNGCITG